MEKQEVVTNKYNLRAADLRDANLWGADLRDANLQGADLRHANLRGANLRGANLQCANLRYANLRDANLRDADLRDADLRDSRFINGVQISKNPIFIHYIYNIIIFGKYVKIGCKLQTIDEWKTYKSSNPQWKYYKDALINLAVAHMKE